MFLAVKTVKRDWCVLIRPLLVTCAVGQSIVSKISWFDYCFTVLSLLSISRF